MSRFIATSFISFAALLAVLFFGAAMLTGCAQSQAQGATAPPDAKVTAAPVLARDVTEWDDFTGRLEAVNTVAVRPRVSGYVSGVTFQEGAIVHKGDVLFEIDARPFQAEVDRLRAELARVKATVQRANAELQRANNLAGDNAMAPEEHDRRAAFAAESAAQVDAVAAGLRAAELNLEFTRVTSPIDGRAGRAIITAGNLVSSGPGEGTLLTTVVSLDPMYATFDTDEQTFLRYTAPARERMRGNTRDSGLPIRMALAGDDGFPREGKMDFLDNQVNPATGTIRSRAVFHNGDRALTPGLFVRLRVPGRGQDHSLLVQDRAIGTDLDKRFVYIVAADHTIQYRAVTIGPLVDGLRVVRNGLKPGDLVVVNGLQRIRPGAHVDVTAAVMDAPAGERETGEQRAGGSE
jgi:RND family efflux transporter MFP subunit